MGRRNKKKGKAMTQSETPAIPQSETPAEIQAAPTETQAVSEIVAPETGGTVGEFTPDTPQVVAERMLRGPDPLRPESPTIGRIVHYILPRRTPNGGEHRAAIVSEILPDQTLTLTVLKGRREDFDGVAAAMGNGPENPVATVCGVRHDQSGEISGTWHWPE